MLHATYLGSIVRQAVGPYELKVVPELAFRLVLLLLYFLEHSLQVHGVGNYCNDGLERTPEARVNRNHRHNNPEHQLLPPASRTLRHRGYPRKLYRPMLHAMQTIGLRTMVTVRRSSNKPSSES